MSKYRTLDQVLQYHQNQEKIADLTTVIESALEPGSSMKEPTGQLIQAVRELETLLDICGPDDFPEHPYLAQAPELKPENYYEAMSLYVTSIICLSNAYELIAKYKSEQLALKPTE